MKSKAGHRLAFPFSVELEMMLKTGTLIVQISSVLVV